MAEHDSEIVVDDPTAPADESPAVTSRQTVETATYVVLLALAALLAWDNWKSGIGWASDGPRAGYFPFYLAVVLAAASVWGLVGMALKRREAREVFVTRDQLRRVGAVFVPTLAFCA